MSDRLKAACIQITSGPDIQENLENIADIARQAAADGARFILTPENSCHIRWPMARKLETAVKQEDHPGVTFFSKLAKELGVNLLIGSMAVLSENAKLLNRSFLFAPDGKLQETYDKIHLFDVELPNGEKYRESDIMHPGDRAVTHHLQDGFTAGFSICYDVRFSYLYRALAQKGANIMCVPAAFTVPTGRAHWETLLRARAIETGSYILAAAQTGEHEGGRKTYGHSMIISPWGDVLNVMEDRKGYIIADLDVSEVERVRSNIPALIHDREFNI